MPETHDKIQPIITAGTNPEQFTDNFFTNKTVLIVTLSLLILIGFAFRVANLGTESLSEDELNKLQTVAEYRENGLSGRNGEHPFLMKGLQTLSVAASETWNNAFPQQSISTEAALRFPTVLFGSLLILLLYLLVNQLFGSFPALVTAVLYAVTPSAIAFDRIAKEDTFLLFFFVWSLGFGVALVQKGLFNGYY